MAFSTKRAGNSKNVNIVKLCLCLFALYKCPEGVKAQKSRPQYVTLYGQVTQTADYCGGVMPSEEKLKALATPEPLSQKTIYLIQGRKNTDQKRVLQTLITDANGRFSVRVKVGQTYAIIDDWKKDPLQIPQNTEEVTWDAACLRERYETPELVLTAKRSNNRRLKINLHKRCFFRPYCGLYTGPIPP